MVEDAAAEEPMSVGSAPRFCCAVEWAVLPMSGKMGVRGVVREEPVDDRECWIGRGFWRAGG